MLQVIVIVGFCTEYVLVLLPGTNPLVVIQIDHHHPVGGGFNTDSVDLGSKGVELPCLLDRMPLKADKTQWQTSEMHGDPWD